MIEEEEKPRAFFFGLENYRAEQKMKILINENIIEHWDKEGIQECVLHFYKKN